MKRYDNIDDVISFARQLPEFPNKAAVVQCLETRNMNRYAQALVLIEDGRTDGPVHESLVELEKRIKALAASDIVSE